MDERKKAIFEFRRIAIAKARKMRRRALDSLHQGEADREREWLSEFVRSEIQDAKEFVRKFDHGAKGREGSRLGDKSYIERFLRKQLKAEKQSLADAQQRLDCIREILEDTAFVDMVTPEFNASPEGHIEKAMNTLKDEISRRRQFVEDLTLPRNYGTNKVEIVRAVLPALADADYSDREIARMLAQAMSEAAEEVVNSDYLVNSLAVTIGNIRKQQYRKQYKESP